MKKSETIRNLLETLNAEYTARARQAVPTDAENYNELWRTFWSTYGRETRQRIESLETELRTEMNREIEVGEGVTLHLWSDAHAYTVIARTKTTLTIQRDKATLDPSFRPQRDGMHCTNQDEQTYTYELDPQGEIIKCRWSERNGRFQAGSDGSMRITRGRREFHDYNF